MVWWANVIGETLYVPAEVSLDANFRKRNKERKKERKKERENEN